MSTSSRTTRAAKDTSDPQTCRKALLKAYRAEPRRLFGANVGNRTRITFAGDEIVIRRAREDESGRCCLLPEVRFPEGRFQELLAGLRSYSAKFDRGYLPKSKGRA